jgi:hypothetical protein
MLCIGPLQAGKKKGGPAKAALIRRIGLQLDRAGALDAARTVGLSSRGFHFETRLELFDVKDFLVH